MKKQFILSKIEAVQDGSPYVYVGFIDPNDSRTGEVRQLNPFGPKAMAFSSPEDLMKNLPKAIGNISRMLGGGYAGVTEEPSLKISMKDYEDMAIKVGDKVTIELKKTNSGGIYS